MTNEMKNVPELRFPGFEGEWRLINLKNCFHTIKNGFVGTATPFYTDNSGVRYLQSNNVKNGFLNDNVKIYVTKEFNEKYKSNQLKSGDMLMVQSGHAGATAVVSDAYEGSNCHALIIMKPKSNINTVFLNNYFQSGKGVKSIYSLITGNTIKHILSSDVKKITFSTPVIGEQEKIGDFFSKLDRQIELEEQKLSLLEGQKKGYMQKLFSQELRFKDQDGNDYPKWEKKFIKDIFIFENNRRKPITSSLREKGLYPYYGATGIIDYVKDYLFNNEERLLIGEDGAKWGQFEKSSFIANGQYWVNNHAHVVKSNNHNLYFMNYYLNFKELRTFVTGNAPAKLTHANLCNINLEIPCLNEQGKISALLKSIDKKMNNQINKIVLLKRRKQGLLQKMFV
ncbi:restriction endonuclease subunit S [Staphylococcus equorum]|nr:restriction endonuclease subunit S [Staphylococcus equorum]RIL27756.1 restriction endonuclease subunit S [Staphylococcus equorum]